MTLILMTSGFISLCKQLTISAWNIKKYNAKEMQVLNQALFNKLLNNEGRSHVVKLNPICGYDKYK